MQMGFENKEKTAKYFGVIWDKTCFSQNFEISIELQGKWIF